MTFTLRAPRSDEATASVKGAPHIMQQKETLTVMADSHKGCISQNRVFCWAHFSVLLHTVQVCNLDHIL